MRALFLLATIVVAAAADSRSGQRIVGGSLTTINQYPFSVALLYSPTGSGNFYQSCGGTILNNRSVLTVAHCIRLSGVANWRVRVGSNFANSGGNVLNSNRFTIHPQYNPNTGNNDVGIIRTNSNIPLSNTVQVARIAGPNYILADNQVLWTIGWGRQSFGGPPSEQLRHAQIWAINQAICRQRYAYAGRTVTDDMLCSGWLDVGGRGQCEGDFGGPVLHNGVVVGVTSWGFGCGDSYYPIVNVRVSRVSNWIQANA